MHAPPITSVRTASVAAPTPQRERPQPQPRHRDEARLMGPPPMLGAAGQPTGRPLDENTRAMMSSRFGHDFRAVRVHTDATAAASARALGARAYTWRNDIVFGPGEARWHARDGLRLLAHELAHVVQQARGGDASPAPEPGGALETEAAAAAAAFARDDGTIRITGASRPAIARQSLLEDVLAGDEEPRSLSGSVSRKPEDTNDAALAKEVRLLKKWLARHRDDANHPQLSSELMDLEAEALRRKNVKKKPRPAPVPRLEAQEWRLVKQIVDARNCSATEEGFRELLRRERLELPYARLLMEGKLAFAGMSPRLPEKDEPEYWANRIPQDLRRPIALGQETTFNEKWKRVCIDQPGDQGDKCEDVEVSTWTMTGPALRAYIAHLGEGLTDFEEKIAAGAAGFTEFTPIAPGSKLLGYYAATGGSGQRTHTVYDREGGVVEQFTSEAPLVNMGIGPIAFVIPGGRVAALGRAATSGAVRMGQSVVNKLAARTREYTFAAKLRFTPGSKYLAAGMRGADDFITPIGAGGGAGMAQTSALVVRSETAAASTAAASVARVPTTTTAATAQTTAASTTANVSAARAVQSSAQTTAATRTLTASTASRTTAVQAANRGGGVGNWLRSKILSAAVRGAVASEAFPNYQPGVATGAPRPAAMLAAPGSFISAAAAHPGSVLYADAPTASFPQVAATATQASPVASAPAANVTNPSVAQAPQTATTAAPAASVAAVSAPHAEGAEVVQVSPQEYAARLSFVTPQQYDNPVLRGVEQAGQQAAAVLSNPATPAGARFIQACRNRNWALAGTLFHSEAARQIQAIAPQLAGITITAEDTVQPGRGGSRLDVTAIDAAGNHYDIDWKTTGRSAFSSSARAELQRHATHYQANRGAPLNYQLSKSWVDFVRSLIPNVRWPK